MSEKSTEKAVTRHSGKKLKVFGKLLHKKARDGKMSMVSHLDEFRKRLTVCIVCFVAALVVCFMKADWLVTELMALGKNFQFVYISPTELIMCYVRIAMIGGVVVAVPVIIYEIWRFIQPGLTKSEQKATLIVLALGLLLFCLGAVFSFKIVLPIVLVFFAGLDTSGTIQAMVSIENYISFMVTMLVTFGVVFELPIVTVLLTKVGILNPRFLSKNRKYVLLIILTVAAFITPPDVTSQVLVAGPMYVLFEFSLVLCRILFKKKLESEASEEMA